ncbi:MAG: LPS export ABC transporter permease LptG [bacterium]
MNTLDRYIASEFLASLTIAVLGFFVIYITLDMVEKVDDFVDNNVPISTVLKFYIFQVPYIFTLTLPVATLISCLFTFGGMARYNELIAIKASGVRFLRTILPLVVIGFGLSLLSMVVSETIQPIGSSNARKIKETEIKKRIQAQTSRKVEVTYRGAEGVFYFTPDFDRRRQIMKNVVIEKTQDGRVIFRINAREAKWQDSIWVLSDGWIRWFNREGEIEREDYLLEKNLYELRDSPREIARESRKPEEMGYYELLHLVRKIEQSGADATKYRVGLAMKISFPFTNLILILIAAPLSSRLRKGGIAIGIGIGLGIAFVYYGLIRIGQALGDRGFLPPSAAAWLGNWIFAILGLILVIRSEKY